MRLCLYTLWLHLPRRGSRNLGLATAVDQLRRGVARLAVSAPVPSQALRSAAHRICFEVASRKQAARGLDSLLVLVVATLVCLYAAAPGGAAYNSSS